MPVFLKRLVSSRKFWIASFGVAQSVVFHFIPTFPKEIWMSIDGLCAVLIASIAAEDVGASIAKAQAQAVNVHLNGGMAAGAVLETSTGIGVDGGGMVERVVYNPPSSQVGVTGSVSGFTSSNIRGE